MTNQIPSGAEEFAKWTQGVEFDFDAPTPTDLPGPDDRPAEGIMVKRSVKWSSDLDDRLKEKAAAKGINQSELIRQYMEMGLAAEASGMVVNLADVYRVLATVAHPPAAA
jgi:hypothetical protein